jgi:hypothetical protein
MTRQQINKIFYLLLLFQSVAFVAHSQSAEIKGQILDDHQDAVPNTMVRVYKNGVLKLEASVDYDGYYDIKPLKRGKYDLIATYRGYDTALIKNIRVRPNHTVTLNFTMKSIKHKNTELIMPKTYDDKAAFPPELNEKIK